jgi:mono/diheme cytochrome c family protein
MIPRLFAIAPALTLLALGGPATAEDAPNARGLYEQHCVKCHGAEVFTRPDRKIDSYAALARQVRWCETNLELRWFDEDVVGVTDYLNNNYYKFKP